MTLIPRQEEKERPWGVCVWGGGFPSLVSAFPEPTGPSAEGPQQTNCLQEEKQTLSR